MVREFHLMACYIISFKVGFLYPRPTRPEWQNKYK